MQDVRIGHNSIKGDARSANFAGSRGRTSRPPAAQFIISAPRSVNYPHRAPTPDS